MSGPRDVGPDELAGIVVDTQGKPIEGVEVDAFTWYPGNETLTNARVNFGSRSSARIPMSRSSFASTAIHRSSFSRSQPERRTG